MKVNDETFSSFLELRQSDWMMIKKCNFLNSSSQITSMYQFDQFLVENSKFCNSFSRLIHYGKEDKSGKSHPEIVILERDTQRNNVVQFVQEK